MEHFNLQFCHFHFHFRYSIRISKSTLSSFILKLFYTLHTPIFYGKKSNISSLYFNFFTSFFSFRNISISWHALLSKKLLNFRTVSILYTCILSVFLTSKNSGFFTPSYSKRMCFFFNSFFFFYFFLLSL